MKTRSPLTKANLAAPDGKPPLGPELRLSALSTTSPVRHSVASGERAQAAASCRARASNAATFTPAGDGLGDAAADADPTADADDAGCPAGCPGAAAAQPAIAAKPRQASRQANEPYLARGTAASSIPIRNTPLTLDATRRFPRTLP